MSPFIDSMMNPNRFRSKFQRFFFNDIQRQQKTSRNKEIDAQNGGHKSNACLFVCVCVCVCVCACVSTDAELGKVETKN